MGQAGTGPGDGGDTPTHPLPPRIRSRHCVPNGSLTLSVSSDRNRPWNPWRNRVEPRRGAAQRGNGLEGLGEGHRTADPRR